jgi:RNA-splicing ligase RtcB
MGRSDFLFASPSFLTGAGRVMDLGAALEYCNYDISRSPEEADIRAIASDWQVVGDDLTRAVEAVRAKLDLRK